MSQSDVALFAAHEQFNQAMLEQNGFIQFWILFVKVGGHSSWMVTNCSYIRYFENNGLGVLCRLLDRLYHKVMLLTMVDMYSEIPICETVHKRTSSLLDTCQYFDPGPYDVYPSPEFPFIKIRGGARRRCFWDANTNGRPPALSKVPLIKWQRGYKYISSTHAMFPAPQTIPEICGALRHFKFLNDFHHRARVESSREQLYANAIQYKEYLKKMDEIPT